MNTPPPSLPAEYVARCAALKANAQPDPLIAHLDASYKAAAAREAAREAAYIAKRAAIQASVDAAYATNATPRPARK